MTTFWADSAAIFSREVLRYRRDRAYWVGQLLFPLVVVGFIGYGLNDVVKLPSQTDYIGHLATGILALLVSSAGVGGGFTLVQDRDSGFLRPLWIAPISRAAIVAGKIASRLLASLLLVGVLVALLSGWSELALPHLWAVVLATTGITVSFVALGIGLASSLNSLESFRLLAGLVTVPIYFLSGIFYPIETLPAVMRGLAYMNPLTYGVDLFRYGLLSVHELPLGLSAGLLVVLTLAASAVAVWAFSRRGPGA